MTPGEVAEGTEGAEEVVEEASTAKLHPHAREPLRKDLEIKEKEGDAVGAAEAFDELVEAALHLPVDEVLPEAVHPHLLVSVVVEGAVGAFLEEVETAEPHPQRRRRLSMRVSL